MTSLTYTVVRGNRGTFSVAVDGEVYKTGFRTQEEAWAWINENRA